MTTLTEHLTGVADAIREKEGSQDQIPASEFAERIRNLKGGGAGTMVNFDEMSWEEIAAMSAEAAKDPDSYKYMTGLGTKFEKTIELTGITQVSQVKCLLIGVGQDVDGSGNKLGFTFQLRDGLAYNQPTNMRMNASNDTSGGWEKCEMRTTNLPKIEAALPTELRGLLKTVKKKTNMTGSGTSVVETTDKLTLLSMIEVFGSQGYVTDGSHDWMQYEGEQYQWYASHNWPGDRCVSRNKQSDTDNVATNSWWLRSIYSSTNFGYVSNNGTWGNSSASSTYLPCACFSV